MGFRFVQDGGIADPLPQYEAAFSGLGSGRSACWRTGDRVAVRFEDPLGRKDAAGRIIPHEFGVFPPLSGEIETVGDALEKLWPRVAEEYDRLWDPAPE